MLPRFPRFPMWLGLGGWLLMAGTGASVRLVAQELKPGMAAPDFDFPTLDGGRIRLSTLRGRPVIVTFWGTWCPPCREEFPLLTALYKEHSETGLAVVAVDQRDQEFSTADVSDFAKQTGVTFPVALDQRGRSRRTFRLIALPTTIMIDSAGVIREWLTGPMTRARLDRALASVLPDR